MQLGPTSEPVASSTAELGAERSPSLWPPSPNPPHKRWRYARWPPAVLQDPQRDIGRREDGEMVRRFRERSERRKHGTPQMSARPGLTGKTRLQSEAAKIVEHAPRPVAGTVGRPDQNHVGRMKQPRNRAVADRCHGEALGA
jgi:hypothetical protein